MQEQAGIYRLDLYEAKGLSVTYADRFTIESISNTGDIISIENSDCTTFELQYEFDLKRAESNKLSYKNTLIWKQLGLTDSNLDLINQLKESIYQWIAVIEFYKADKKIIINPFQFIGAEIDNNVSNHYLITLRNTIFGQRIKDFVPLTGQQNFISTDVPGGNIADSYIPTENDIIKLS